jgi:phage repressor protein C with HTH and peptisase S24 domain
MAGSDPRAALQRLIEERGEDYSGLSRLIGRNAAYVQQYIKRGTPKALAEEDRRVLARYFGVAEDILGGPAEPERVPLSQVRVPRLDVGASAGPGALPGDERPSGQIGFDPAWLRRLGIHDARYLSIIAVEGDSMLPTLSGGDEILVDRGDAADRLRDGIYVLRMEDVLMVKRLALHPAPGKVAIKSDNPVYPSWAECDLSAIDVVGRVVWVGRRLA